MGSDSTISRSGRQGSPLPDTDLARAPGSNFLSNISLEPGRTGYVESLVRIQAQADDLLLDLGGAAEARLDAAEPPELTIAESGGLAARRSPLGRRMGGWPCCRRRGQPPIAVQVINAYLACQGK